MLDRCKNCNKGKASQLLDAVYVEAFRIFLRDMQHLVRKCTQKGRKIRALKNQKI